MKKKSNSLKISSLLLIIIMTIGVSCKDNNDPKKQIKKLDQIDDLEDDESFAGSSKRKDICLLITESDIREIFALDNDVKIEQKKNRSASCTYKWESSDGNRMFYRVSLNFAKGEKRSKNQIDKIWENQNNTVYKKRELQKISGVGDKASWSDLGGGQLRVSNNGYIFYVSHSIMVMPGEDKPKNTQEMINRTKDLASRVIAEM